MSMPFTSETDQTILHQSDVEAVIDARAGSEFASRGTTVIADPVAPGAAYAQAEAASTHDALVALLAACRAAGIIA